jgi:hypothetical protein
MLLGIYLIILLRRGAVAWPSRTDDMTAALLAIGRMCVKPRRSSRNRNLEREHLTACDFDTYRPLKNSGTQKSIHK